ncbi:P-loop containing nucleoside triphosphate hydrolase protein [Boletus edulis]|nr:P-loop containing nucleoside triphosphate hydrolase protein [Boletus edulis]
MVCDRETSANISPYIATTRHQHPPNHPGSSVPDNAAVRGAQSSSSIDVDDIVIAVMGITRAGKSSVSYRCETLHLVLMYSQFINKAAGRMEIVITNDLASQTRAVRPVRCLHPDGRRNVVLVDTPGFDDTHLSDAQTLRILAHWLKETYQNNIKLSGLLYLHRISDNRMAGTPLRHLSVFKELCGEDSMKNIVLVTTMWDVEDESVGSEREEQLLSVFWKDMIRLGSRTCRFQGTHESAWEIISCLDLERSGQRRTPLQVQQEMVDRGLPLHQTIAAKTLLRSLTKRLGKAKKLWATLRNRARRRSCPTEDPSLLELHTSQDRSSTIGSNSSEVSWPAESTLSGCSASGRQNISSATIEVLWIDHQRVDIHNVPVLREIIGTALSIARLIQGMGGTHHAIVQAIEYSGWLLDEIAQHAMRSATVLSRDMKRALSTFQRDLINLEKAVTSISGRDGSARFFLHEADLQTITVCTASIKAVYHKLDIKLAIDNRHPISRLDDQVTELWANPAQRQCECGMHDVPPGDAQEMSSHPLPRV